jgi:thiol-disulfide isomerase/thioredoxin
MTKQKDNTIRKTISVFLAFTVISLCNAQQPDSAQWKMMPEIPENITEPSGRAAYLVLHYWDKYNFGDTSFLMTNNLLERSFVDYLDLLSLVSEDSRDESVSSLMKKAEGHKTIFLLLVKLSEKYLYDPDSPVYDEEKFIPFLQYEINSPLLDDAEKIRPGFLLESVMKNRTGHTASDFTYTLADDGTGTLHAVKADYVLLYFNDPECEDCLALTRRLIVSPILNDFIKQGKLKILTVYTNDDVEAWKKHAPDVLNSWIYSRDAGQIINMEGVYNIKRFPTIYLLDKDKKVLLKETAFEKLEDYFRKQ